MGRLIPAGTGMPRYRYMGIRIEGADAGLEDERPAESRPSASGGEVAEVGLMARSGGSNGGGGLEL
jgi:hypothetical protein